MHVIDLNEEHYPAQLTTTWDEGLNGNRSISSIIKPSKVNLQFIHDITEMWRIVDDDDTEYKIVYCKRQGTGNLLTADVKALPKYQDDLNNQRIHRRIDQHLTANAFFHIVFNEEDELGNASGYNFILNGTFEAQQWEGLGEGSTRLEMLKNGLNRYKAEFRISGNTIYIENQIGNDTSHRYEHRLNASNIVQEIDANEFWTYAKGYGDYGDGEGGEDWRNAKVIREYTSPLAQIPAIGIREAPPIKNGNYKADFMDSQLKILVNESLKISVTADIHDLTKQGYPIAQSQLGDRVFLIDPRIGFDEEIRVSHKSITKDWTGKIIDIKLTFGAPGLVKRHQSNINAAVKNITNLLEGNLKLPFSVYDARVQEATKAMLNVLTQLTVLDNGSFAAIDKDNPNNVVIFNANGLFVSNDGGATAKEAIWGNGINTSLLTSGSIQTDNISIVGDSNYFYWDGRGLYAISPSDAQKYVRLRSDGLFISKGAIEIRRPDGYALVNDGMLNTDFNVQFSPTPHLSSGAVQEGYYVKTSDTSPRIIANGRFRRDGRYLKIIVGLWTTQSGTTARMRVRSQGDNPTIYATTTETSQDSGFESAQRTLTVDLGTPNGSRTSFYVELYSSNGNEVRGYVHSAWLEG